MLYLLYIYRYTDIQIYIVRVAPNAAVVAIERCSIIPKSLIPKLRSKIWLKRTPKEGVKIIFLHLFANKESLKDPIM